jgi:hypothetical protein
MTLASRPRPQPAEERALESPQPAEERALESPRGAGAPPYCTHRLRSGC